MRFCTAFKAAFFNFDLLSYFEKTVVFSFYFWNNIPNGSLSVIYTSDFGVRFQAAFFCTRLNCDLVFLHRKREKNRFKSFPIYFKLQLKSHSHKQFH